MKNFKPHHDFLVAIDSDGCAFDTMEIKHKKCVIPNIINHWKLQPISQYVQKAAEFVNLYSKWRGINRFPALIMVFDLLKDWPDVQKRNVELPNLQALRDWMKKETTLSNSHLKLELEKTNDSVMKQTLVWSEAVNETVSKLVHDIPPFPKVKESLEKLHPHADIIVCSVTSTAELHREWQEHDLAKYTSIIAGQEMGSKAEHIRLAKNNHYAEDHILMIGDAPGDMDAAHANNTLFYPIIPGHEADSWERCYQEIIDLFLEVKYTKIMEAELIAEFQSYLPEKPPWK